MATRIPFLLAIHLFCLCIICQFNEAEIHRVLKLWNCIGSAKFRLDWRLLYPNKMHHTWRLSIHFWQCELTRSALKLWRNELWNTHKNIPFYQLLSKCTFSMWSVNYIKWTHVCVCVWNYVYVLSMTDRNELFVAENIINMKLPTHVELHHQQICLIAQMLYLTFTRYLALYLS